MTHILITGGLGFVGGRLGRQLSADYQVTVSTRKQVAKDSLLQHGPVTVVPHQLLLTKDGFPKNIQTVIHLAALNERDCVSHPSDAIRVNIDETRIILENSIAAGAQNFIYFSTAHIYMSPLQGNITEETLPAPLHPYAITHRAAEDYIIAAGRQKKIHSVVVRLSNSFGAPVLPDVNRWTLLANDLARQAIEKGELTLLSNGCQHRDFVCLTDVAQVINGMLNRGPQQLKREVYNLGSGISTPVIEMARMIAGLYKELFSVDLPIKLPFGAVPTVEPEVHFSIQRLLSEGFVINNDIVAELKQLLIFCNQHFKRHG